MIGQYLSNTNESATIHILQKKNENKQSKYVARWSTVTPIIVIDLSP